MGANEIPILFNGEMVRAILDGRKRQTRRPLLAKKDKPPGTMGFMPINSLHQWVELADGTWAGLGHGRSDVSEVDLLRSGSGVKHPMGQRGNVLWVRETFATLRHGSYEQCKPHPECVIRYRADDPLRFVSADIRGHGWQPSIHMPRWACRIKLLVDRVWIERLGDIDDAGALAEGVERLSSPRRTAFMAMWDSIYPGSPSHVNPWVFACEFQVLTTNARDEA